jgi:ethanolamine phosphate phosphodiesterase
MHSCPLHSFWASYRGKRIVAFGRNANMLKVLHLMEISTPQHTLGTISWQQGNLYPSFMLLSAGPKLSQNSTDLEHEVAMNLCFLPKQTHIYIW